MSSALFGQSTVTTSDPSENAAAKTTSLSLIAPTTSPPTESLYWLPTTLNIKYKLLVFAPKPGLSDMVSSRISHLHIQPALPVQPASHKHLHPHYFFPADPYDWGTPHDTVAKLTSFHLIQAFSKNPPLPESLWGNKVEVTNQTQNQLG